MHQELPVLASWNEHESEFGVLSRVLVHCVGVGTLGRREGDVEGLELGLNDGASVLLQQSMNSVFFRGQHCCPAAASPGNSATQRG